MMQILAGPYTIQRAGIDDRPTTPSLSTSAFWDDVLGVGSIGAYTSVGDVFGYGPNYFVWQMDGTAGVRGKAVYGSVMIDTRPGGDRALYESHFDGVLGAAGFVYEFDIRTGIIDESAPIASGANIFTNSGTYPQILTADRVIRIGGNSITKRALDGSDLSWIAEHTLTPTSALDPLYSGFPNKPSVSKTKDPGVICLIYPSGGVLFYDVNAQEQVFPETWTPWIGANDMAWFSVRLNVYIVFNYITSDDGEISVYANSVRPDSISAPAAVTALGTGKVSQVKTRVLGTKSEPCEDELITWSILSGNGTLSATQSTTDADGYAYVNYIAPLVAGVNPAIQASLEF